MTTTDPLKAAAVIVAGYAGDAPAGSPDRRICTAYAGLFEHAAGDGLVDGARLVELLTDAAAGVVELEAGDVPDIPPAPPADILDRALDVMLTNADAAPPSSAPKMLAEAVVALLVHTMGRPNLDDLLRLLHRFAAAVVAVDEAELGDQLGDQVNAARRGAEFARSHGVDVPADSTRFRLRWDAPARLDVYDDEEERCAVLTEQRGGTEWRVAAIAPDGYAETLDTVSFARAVERLDRFVAERR